MSKERRTVSAQQQPVGQESKRQHHVAGRGAAPMSGRKRAYPAEYRHHIVELARGGRTPTQLASEFECSRETIRKWVKRTQQEESCAAVGTCGVASGENQRLLKENRRLREECRILQKVVALFARASGA